MAKPIHDQAEGLRRLLVHDFLRIATITSGSAGAGKTTAVINLAAALARNGKNVLVIDENVSANNVCATLGLSAHRDLLDVIRHDKTLEEVIVTGPNGLSVLPAGRGMPVLGSLSTGDQAHLIGAFAHISKPIDVVLIDGASGKTSRSLSLALSSHETVLVVSPEPESITAAYGLIKYVSSRHQDKQDYHVLVNKVHAESEAQKIFHNMQSVAKRHLAVPLHFMGFVPYEGKDCLKGALSDTFPADAVGTAFRHAAESLVHWSCGEGEGRGLERFMQCLLQSSQANMPDALAANSR